MEIFSGQFTQETITQLIGTQALTSFFQPIFSRQTGKVHGYEALTRLALCPSPDYDIGQLFAKAQRFGLISSLDMSCRENAFRRAAELGFAAESSNLFINICPAGLMHPDYKTGMTDQFADWHGIDKERVVLEITEQEAIRNYELFKCSVERYRKRGYKIAIDDFGVGYGGLKMLSIIEPDYLKVDRHFITNIDTDPCKYNLVDALATVCHKLGIIVIAEGIERPEELETVSRFGIEMLQGFLLERPGPTLLNRQIEQLTRLEEEIPGQEDPLAITTIGAIARHVEPLTSSQPLLDAHHRFMADQTLQSIPVVERYRLVGMLSRKRFLENQMIGPYGFGFALSTHHSIHEVLEPDFLAVEATLPIEKAVSRIQGRRSLDMGDDLGVSRNGRYIGTAAINDILAAITRKSMQLAKGANPLSGLPGNAFIQKMLTRLITHKTRFAVCYFDIDDFKPFNDYYSFEKGDSVIKTLGELIVEMSGSEGDDSLPFVGHIGGDDFIAIIKPQLAYSMCKRVIAEFEKLLPLFHGSHDYGQGYYIAKDRQGTERQIPLMGLSIGIVSTDECHLQSYGELANICSGVKKAAKAQKGSAIICNRRSLIKVKHPAATLASEMEAVAPEISAAI